MKIKTLSSSASNCSYVVIKSLQLIEIDPVGDEFRRQFFEASL